MLRPLADGVPGAYHPYDWAAGRFDPDPVPVAAAPVLVVEGCGSGARVLAPWTTLLVWVEAPQPLRLARGLARDGAALEAHWRRWQRTEAAAFAAEDTRARAGAADRRSRGRRRNGLRRRILTRLDALRPRPTFAAGRP